jgi:hypothetical protein
MSTVWLLEYEGVKRPLADWGIDSADVTDVNQATGELVFTTSDEGANDEPRFVFEKLVTLWRNQTRFFTGPIVSVEFSAAPDEVHRYRAASPWWYLENIIFQQPSWVLRDAEEALLGYTTVTTSRTVLGLAPNGGRHDTSGQVGEIVDYAISKGAPISRGVFDLTTFIPYEKGEDLTCAEAIRRVLRWTHDAVAYWDYTAAVPLLEIKKRANLTTASIDLDAADSVTQIAITPRNDLVPRGIHIRYRMVMVDIKGAQYIAYTSQTAGDVSERIRCLSYTISLAGAGSQMESPPPGLAANLFASMSQLEFDGTVRLLEEEVSGGARVGRTLNILNGKGAWTEMKATIQSVTLSLLTGETTLTIGPPSQLGVEDFLDLARYRRGQDAGGAVDEKFNGTPSEPNKPPPSPPNPGQPPAPGIPTIQELEVCENGKKVKIRVTGTRVS